MTSDVISAVSRHSEPNISQKALLEKESIVYCPNASRGLSAMAELLMMLLLLL